MAIVSNVDAFLLITDKPRHQGRVQGRQALPLLIQFRILASAWKCKPVRRSARAWAPARPSRNSLNLKSAIHGFAHPLPALL